MELTPDAVEAISYKRGRERDDLRFLHTGLERLGDILVDAVDHGRGHVEQRQLIDVLYRVPASPLAVAHLDPELLQFEQHWRLDIQAEHVADASASRIALISFAAS
jgi:hypothetical protein